MRLCEKKKYCRARQATYDNMALCALHAGYLRLQTHSGCVILIAFPLQQRLHEDASVSRYTHIDSLVI